MPVSVVKSPKEEKIWKTKVKEVEKSKDKKKSEFTDQDWGLVNMLFQKAKKKYGGKRLPKKYAAAASFLPRLEATAKASFSSDLVKSVISWIADENYDAKWIIARTKFPLHLRKINKTVYRGMVLSVEQYENLKKGKAISAQIGSWTTDIDTASRFAFDSSAEIRGVFKLKPKQDQIIVNIHTLAMSNEFKKVAENIGKDLDYFYELIETEEEVLMKSVSLTKKNLVEIFES